VTAKERVRGAAIASLVAPIASTGVHSPLFPPACRFTAHLSQYAIEALRLHGPFKALLAMRRLRAPVTPFRGSEIEGSIRFRHGQIPVEPYMEETIAICFWS